MNSASHHLFVYSSLLKGFRSPEYEYVTKYFDFVNHGKVRGILSDTGVIVVGTPVDDERYISGELYKIKMPELFSFAIGQLDDYEGIGPEEGAPPSNYKRELATIYLESGDTVPAWVYWYAHHVNGLPVIESGNVMQYLKIRGYI